MDSEDISDFLAPRQEAMCNRPLNSCWGFPSSLGDSVRRAGGRRRRSSSCEAHCGEHSISDHPEPIVDIASSHSSDPSQLDSFDDHPAPSADGGSALLTSQHSVAGSIPNIRLRCPLWFLGCDREEFVSVWECFAHSLMHFVVPGTFGVGTQTVHQLVADQLWDLDLLLVQPPEKVFCPLRDCDSSWQRPGVGDGIPGRQTDQEDDYAHWRLLLEHLEMHLQEGHTLDDCPPEGRLVRFLADNGLIGQIKLRELTGNWEMRQPNPLNVRIHGGAAETRHHRRRQFLS